MHKTRAGPWGGIVALVVAGVVSGGAAAAHAQTVHFTGSNIGCFYTTGPACTPTGASGTTVLDGSGLSYTGSTFDAFTSFGYLGIGDMPNTGPGHTNFNNLGSFSLANGNYNFQTQPVNFVLATTFTSPTNASTVFTAMLHGAVTSDGHGGASVVFNGAPQTIAYGGGNSFTYSVNNLALVNGGNVSVTGQVMTSGSTVPEPGVVALLSTGLLGLAPFARRKRTSRRT